MLKNNTDELAGLINYLIRISLAKIKGSRIGCFPFYRFYL
jgi:hypothetical protein